MSKIIVNLPGLDPGHARQLVRNALTDWVRARRHNYVDKRYAHMDDDFRVRRAQRLEKEVEALDNGYVDCIENEAVR